MKKRIWFLPITVFSGIATVLTGLIWINNIVCAHRTYQAMFSGVDIFTNPQSGFWPALDWSTLDVSTISTFIPFFGFLCMLIGCLRFFRGLRYISDDFPFFAAYDRINVSLGLLGTVWGIILIGFFPAQEIGVGTLMLCLHTALFSTLIAVAWVSIILPVSIRPIMQFIARQAAGARASESGDLLELIEHLGETASTASEKFAHGSEQVSRFNATLADAGSALRELPKNLTDLLEQLNLTAGKLGEIGQQQSSMVEKNTIFLDKLNIDQESQLRRSTAAVERLLVIQEEFQAQNLELTRQITETQKELFKRCCDVIDRVSSSQYQLETLLETLRKEYLAMHRQTTATEINDEA